MTGRRKVRVAASLLIAALLLVVGCSSTPGGGNMYSPSGTGPYPAVIVLHSKAGLTGHERQFANRLQSEGYVTITANYFADGGVDNINDAYYALMEDPRVDPARVGVVGFSMGAYQAMAFTNRLQMLSDNRVGAIVSYYIGPNVGRGPKNNHPPILFLHGDRDQHTSPESIRRYCDRQRAKGTICEAHIYRGVRHAFDKRTTVYRGYDASVAANAYERTVAFFNQHLN